MESVNCRIILTSDLKLRDLNNELKLFYLTAYPDRMIEDSYLFSYVVQHLVHTSAILKNDNVFFIVVSI